MPRSPGLQGQSMANRAPPNSPDISVADGHQHSLDWAEIHAKRVTEYSTNDLAFARRLCGKRSERNLTHTR
jgi:hypothetical protein